MLAEKWNLLFASALSTLVFTEVTWSEKHSIIFPEAQLNSFAA